MAVGVSLGEVVGARTLGVLWLSAFAAIGAVGCGSAMGPSADTSAGAGGETAAESGQAGMADGDPSAGGAGDGGSVGDAVAGATGEPRDGSEAGAMGQLDAPWNEHSQHVELDCFGFFKGSMLFDADRDELSAEQLRLFDGLRRTRTNQECSADELGCGVAITNDRGEVTAYAADELDSFCGFTPALSYASVEPLLDGLGCKFARESAGPLSASSGCFHGMYVGTAAATVVHQQLSLSEANRSYHVELVHCTLGVITLELLGADPAVPLAVGMPVADPGPKGACVTLDVEVKSPLTADLVITTTGFDAGDFYLNFR